MFALKNQLIHQYFIRLCCWWFVFSAFFFLEKCGNWNFDGRKVWIMMMLQNEDELVRYSAARLSGLRSHCHWVFWVYRWSIDKSLFFFSSFWRDRTCHSQFVRIKWCKLQWIRTNSSKSEHVRPNSDKFEHVWENYSNSDKSKQTKWIRENRSRTNIRRNQEKIDPIQKHCIQFRWIQIEMRLKQAISDQPGDIQMKLPFKSESNHYPFDRNQNIAETDQSKY